MVNTFSDGRRESSMRIYLFFGSEHGALRKFALGVEGQLFDVIGAPE